MVIGVSGGKLYVSNGSDTQKLWFGAIGASIGPSPITASGATSSMWSTGLGKIRQRGGKGELSFSDLQGPMLMLVGAGNLFPGIPEGLNASVVFMDVPYSVVATGLYMPPAGLAGAMMTARAVGVIVGEYVGLDASASYLIGYGR